MTAGRLAAVKPGATTSTSLYRCNIDNTASTVMTATNQSSGALTYRAALRDYDQILQVDGDETTALQFTKGNPISSYKIKITPGIAFADAIPGADIATTNGAVAKLLDVYKDTSVLTRYVKVEKNYSTTVDNSNLVGIPAVGETVTGGTSSFLGSGLGPSVFSTVGLYFSPSGFSGFSGS